MNIQILSDLHLEFGTSPDVFSEKNILGDVLVLAGDIHVSPDLLKKFILTINKVPIILVLGNHEFYGKEMFSVKERYKKLLYSPEENLYLLDNSKVVCPSIVILKQIFPSWFFIGNRTDNRNSSFCPCVS